MKQLEKKVSLITGAGSGMGKAIALLFAREGSQVVAADISAERLAALKLEIDAFGGQVTTVTGSVAKQEDVDKMIAAALSAYGTLDVLVNNAGIMDNFQPADEVDDNLWNKVIGVNLNGPFMTMRAALKIFKEKGKGVIVNNASVAGFKGGAAGAAYTVSKHGLIGLTRNTGYLYSKTNIRCNAIAPGGVATSIMETIDFAKVTPQIKERILDASQASSPRTGDPQEIANVALFLASDMSSFVNGHVMAVDGGWSAF